jgi:hypothetical protein
MEQAPPPAMEDIIQTSSNQSQQDSANVTGANRTATGQQKTSAGNLPSSGYNDPTEETVSSMPTAGSSEMATHSSPLCVPADLISPMGEQATAGPSTPQRSPSSTSMVCPPSIGQFTPQSSPASTSVGWLGSIEYSNADQSPTHGTSLFTSPGHYQHPSQSDGLLFAIQSPRTISAAVLSQLESTSPPTSDGATMMSELSYQDPVHRIDDSPAASVRCHNNSRADDFTMDSSGEGGPTSDPALSGSPHGHGSRKQEQKRTFGTARTTRRTMQPSGEVFEERRSLRNRP